MDEIRKMTLHPGPWFVDSEPRAQKAGDTISGANEMIEKALEAIQGCQAEYLSVEERDAVRQFIHGAAVRIVELSKADGALAKELAKPEESR